MNYLIGAAGSGGDQAWTIAAVVIGFLGLVIAVVSITWQVATFMLSGSRVKVELKTAAIGSAGVVTGPVGNDWEGIFPLLAAQGYETPCLAIEARNVGRLGVDVVRCQVNFENGAKYEHPGHPSNPAPNFRLDHGVCKTWIVELWPLRNIVDATARMGEFRPNQSVTMSIELGTGKILTSKKSVRITPN